MKAGNQVIYFSNILCLTCCVGKVWWTYIHTLWRRPWSSNSSSTRILPPPKQEGFLQNVGKSGDTNENAVGRWWTLESPCPFNLSQTLIPQQPNHSWPVWRNYLSILFCSKICSCLQFAWKCVLCSIKYLPSYCFMVLNILEMFICSAQNFENGFHWQLWYFVCITILNTLHILVDFVSLFCWYFPN